MMIGMTVVQTLTFLSSKLRKREYAKTQTHEKASEQITCSSEAIG